MTDMMDLYGVGDHGGGPTRAMLDEGFHWARPTRTSVAANGGAPVTPKYEFGTAQSYFSAVEKKIAPESPTWNYQSIAKGYEPPAGGAGQGFDSDVGYGALLSSITAASTPRRPTTSTTCATAEEEVLNAEKWSSLGVARWPRSIRRDELTEDWKKVLFNQFHDLAAGSGIGVIYKDAQKDYDWVRMSTNEISSGALQTVAEQIDTRSERVRIVPVRCVQPAGLGALRTNGEGARPGNADGFALEAKRREFRRHVMRQLLSRIAILDSRSTTESTISGFMCPTFRRWATRLVER